MGRAADGVVIVGVSTRALAESAVRAGYRCATVDAFGDLDQRAAVHNLSLQRDVQRRYTAAAAVAVSRRLPATFAAYVGNLENHPCAVHRLAQDRVLLGSSPAALARVRDPWLLSPVVRAAGGRFPDILTSELAVTADPQRAWLRKPVRGGGGSGVASWEPGQRLRAHELLQQRIDGIPASALFAADGRNAVLLGLTRQLAGEPAFGAAGYRYAGNLYPLAVAGSSGERLRARLGAIAGAVTLEFGLRGLCGIDFIAAGDEPWVVEVNPRPPASAELLERASGGAFSVFDTHARACAGELPRAVALPAGRVFGKAILYARRDVVMPDTTAWLQRDDVRDIPFPGDRIRRGHPICTVLRSGAEPDACRAGLLQSVSGLERELYPRESHVHATA